MAGRTALEVDQHGCRCVQHVCSMLSSVRQMQSGPALLSVCAACVQFVKQRAADAKWASAGAGAHDRPPRR